MFRPLAATLVLCLTLPLGRAQSDNPDSNGTTQASINTSAPDVSASKPTALLAPALDQLGKSVMNTHVERWSRSVRDETDANLRSIERDLQNTLPPLLQTADAAPTSIAASFPVVRNLDALIAVVVRVTVAARGTAPANEAEALNKALQVLEGARHSLADQIQQLATAQEKQLADLQSTVKTQAASLAAAQASAPPAPLPPTPPAKTKRPHKAAKPKPPTPLAPQQ